MKNKTQHLMCVLVAQSCPTVTPWTVAPQAPLSMGFSRQEYWSELPCPSPGIFPTQGSNLGLPHCRQILYCLDHEATDSIGKYFGYSECFKSS